MNRSMSPYFAFFIAIVFASCIKQNSGQLTLNRKVGNNLLLDGSFEDSELGQMKAPWICRPTTAPEAFAIKEGNAAESQKYLSYQAQSGDWWGISQKVQLIPGKKYTASFLIRGDSTEIHTGAFNSGKFLGWNNSTVPDKDWQLVSFDFYTDTTEAKTTIYIAGKNNTKDFQVDLDDLQVVQELPELN
ncbi:MAG: carbohydrate binding domain-containing protein [Cyclobacteriaceae bacterium]